MCYNVKYTEKRVEKLKDRYKNTLPLAWNESFLPKELPIFHFASGFDHPTLPIIKNDGIFLFNWGLIPEWIMNLEAANKIQNITLNAVGETVFEKKSFQNSVVNKRCLLPINGFYEWRDFHKNKIPYYIQSSENELFSLACIYDSWIDPIDGNVKNTFSIITCQANPLMEKIHNVKKRMPLILNKDDEENWLNNDLNKTEIIKLIKPYPESKMKAHTISQSVNNHAFDRNRADITEEVKYPELNSIQQTIW